MRRENSFYEAIIIGAGFGGLRALHECHQLRLSVRVFEAGSDVGGTWYWNRYPGARTDSEAWCYCYSFSKELLDEWNWEERMPGWNQVQRYLRHVAERFEMLPDIQFDARIRSAIYDEAIDEWTVTTEQGESFRCLYLISASGVLSVPFRPPFPGIEDFQGECYQSSRWPKTHVAFEGKRVAIIGTGATGVQIIPLVAQAAEHLTVYQRTPNYVMPGRNHALDDFQRQGIRAHYNELWAMTQTQPFAFPMAPAGRMFDDFSPEEQERVFEAGWETGGFRYLFETFDDIIVNPRCNEAAAEFMRKKIRIIVKDQVTANLLCPDYPYGVKRPPVGNFYFEAFNRPNVELVSVQATPIERITTKGIVVDGVERECDLIIFATGFDGVTGALTNFEVRGRNGQLIKDVWASGPRTQLGISVDGFPNLFMISGPQSPFANIPVVIDNCVKWIGAVIDHARREGVAAVETTGAATEAWCQHIQALFDATVLSTDEKTINWYCGTNIPGKKRSVGFYFGGAGAYFQELQDNIKQGFPGFAFSGTLAAHVQPGAAAGSAQNAAGVS